MSTITVTPVQKRALTVAIVIALVGGFLFLQPYFSLVAFAGILAFMFNGLYKWFENKWHNPNRSSMVTLLIALLTLIIPLLIVVAVSIRQIDSLADNVTSSGVQHYVDQGITALNNTLEKIGIDYTVNQATVTSKLQEPLTNFGQNFLKELPSVFSNFFSFFSTAIIFLFVFLSLLKNQKKVIETAHSLNPLGHEISQLYLDKIAAMTKAMVRGQFIIAVAQGFTDAGLLAIAGLPELFFFFFLLLTALSIVPLGGGIVAIPLGIVMMLTGNFWGGLLVVVGHIVIVTNIDNVLRPRLVPKEAKLDSALTLLSVFAGLKMFGFLGIVLGPVIMILIVTTIQVYQEVHGNEQSDGEPHRSKGIIARSFRRVKRVFGKSS
jgi:predicted PurR-regulated permease PerM